MVLSCFYSWGGWSLKGEHDFSKVTQSASGGTLIHKLFLLISSVLEDFEKKTLFTPPPWSVKAKLCHSRRLLGEVSDSVYRALVFSQKEKSDPVVDWRGLKNRDTMSEFLSLSKTAFTGSFSPFSFYLRLEEVSISKLYLAQISWSMMEN